MNPEMQVYRRSQIPMSGAIAGGFFNARAAQGEHKESKTFQRLEFAFREGRREMQVVALTLGLSGLV